MVNNVLSKYHHLVSHFWEGNAKENDSLRPRYQPCQHYGSAAADRTSTAPETNLETNPEGLWVAWRVSCGCVLKFLFFV